MNTRIRELADEAARFSAVMALPTGEPGDSLFVEKFAELIVRECMNTIATSNESRQTAHYYRNLVAEHFGVEK